MAWTPSTAPTMSVVAASPSGYGLQVCKMKEVRFKGGKKLSMPEPIHGMMDPQAQALIYFATVSKLEQHKRQLGPSDRMNHLASVCNLDTLMNTNIQLLTEDYNEQLFVPGNFPRYLLP